MCWERMWNFDVIAEIIFTTDIFPIPLLGMSVQLCSVIVSEMSLHEQQL